MVGLGKWKCIVKHTVFDGVAYLTISEKDGDYAFIVEVADSNVPDFVPVNVVEDGNSLSGTVKIKKLPIKLNFTATFNDDRMSGTIDIPFVGTIEINDAEKVG